MSRWSYKDDFDELERNIARAPRRGRLLDDLTRASDECGPGDRRRALELEIIAQWWELERGNEISDHHETEVRYKLGLPRAAA